MKQTWHLEDVTQIAIDAPYTFYLPSKSVISQLECENIVKLMFNCDVENDQGWSAERMWVIITERNRNIFEGILDNDPYYIPDIKAGDLVEFNDVNILQTDIEDPEPNLVDKYLPRCYVTNSVLLEKNPVSHLFREEPDTEEQENNYSGWNLFSGLEDEGYLNDPDNWSYVSLGAVLNINDRFADLLESEFNSKFSWEESTKMFVKT